ncbi:MAG: outer membrane lipoprotein-sorting protein [Myxococcales bacterium]|nr:outer membrane lipoprotein-sorting protein [Myxococcales bacterium]
MTMLLLWAGAAHAQSADDIVAKARAANQVGSSIQTVRMTIVSKSGSERIRELELRSRRSSTGTTSSYMEVKSPSDLAGTKLLMIDHTDADDEQMSYLPVYNRVNRISGSSRKGYFIGSDFTYEDLDIREAAEGTHSLVQTTDDVWVIETVPADSAQYSKVRAHITKADLVARKIEFFDRKGEHTKTLEVEQTRVVDGVTLPISTKMSNLDRKTHTKLEVLSHELNVDETKLPAETFTPEYLER